MSSIDSIRKAGSVTAGDCARLWSTLTTEYIQHLRIEVRILEDREGGAHLSVEVVDDSYETLNGSPLVNIWASKEYHNPLYLISRDQLFDLLIIAYRAVEAFFANGTPSAPARRPK